MRRGLVIYAVVIALIGWIYESWQIARDQRATLDAVRQQLTVTATAFDNHVQAMINDGVGAAEAAANELRSPSASPSVPNADPETTLARMLTGGEYVRALFMVTPSGFWIADRARADEAQPSWLAELRASAQNSWVGNIELDAPHSERAAIPIAHRVADVEGAPTWAGALFNIEALDDLYRTIPLEHGAVALVSTSGDVLMRVPHVFAQRHRLNVSSWDTFQRALKSGEVAPIDGMNMTFGKPWMFVLHRVRGFDLFAIAGVDREAALAPWRERTQASLAYALATTAALGALTAVLYRVLRRYFARLERSEERYELAVSGTSDGIWDWDIVSNHVYYSARLRELLGYRNEEPFAAELDTFWAHLHADDRPALELTLARHLERSGPYDVHFRMRTRSGEYRWFRSRGQAIFRDGVAVRMAGAVSDVHEQKMMAESLETARRKELRAHEQLSQSLIAAQERERKRIANELHDSLGQNLSLITNRAQLALRAGELPPGASGHMQSIVEITAGAIDEVRALVRNLQPLQIEQHGLTASILRLVDQVTRSSGLEIEHRIDDIDDAYSLMNATHVYRIVQEAFNNILKHAAAVRIELVIERDLHAVRIRIRDDGCGFDSRSVELTRRGIGLSSMAERAHLLGGTFSIESAVASGTVMRVELPIKEEAAGNEVSGSDSLIDSEL